MVGCPPDDLALAILPTDPPLATAASDKAGAPAVVQIILPDPGQPLRQLGIDRLADDPIQLQLEMDGQLVYEGRYEPGDLFSGPVDPVFAEFELEPGQHNLILHLLDGEMPLRRVLFDQSVDLSAGEILRLSYAAGDG